jgi:hypothetical protein
MGIKKICAWCGKVLPELKDSHAAGTSHGICSPCAKFFFGVPARRALKKMAGLLTASDPRSAYSSKA